MLQLTKSNRSDDSCDASANIASLSAIGVRSDRMAVSGVRESAAARGVSVRREPQP